MTQPSKPKKKPGVIRRMLHAASGGYYNDGTATHITSPDESYALFLWNDGRVDLRHNGSHVRYL